MKPPRVSILFLLAVVNLQSFAADTPTVPDWAQPGTATRQQVPPPVDFRRESTHYQGPIGIFEGQSDVGTAVVPGSARFDPRSKSYVIDSAGYNIWYTRDEFRYLWKKMSGDVSLAAEISFPNPDGYFDRKVVLILRQDLEDDSKGIMAALHGGGLIHLAQRPEKRTDMKEDFRMQAVSAEDGKVIKPIRLGIKKQGDTFTLLVGENGQPLQAVGNTGTLKLEEPFYVGIGFTSHLPATVDTGIASNVELEGK